MKKHKNTIKILIAVMAFALVFAMTACGNIDNTEDSMDETGNQDVIQEVQPETEVQEEPEPTVEPEAKTEPEPEPEKTKEPESKPVDEYYLENGDPTKGNDTSVTGIPEIIDTISSDDGNLLVLVNKYHTVSKDYKPAEMVKMDNKMTTYTGLELKEEAYEAYKRMYKDACDLGFDLKVCSAYRTYSTQVTLYVNSLKNRGRETTNIRSAYPGRSEHHTGLSLDITSKSMGMTLSQDFADYEDGKWLNDNCQEYGFILRYPQGKTDITGYAYEPWHFRYVGVDAAKDIMARGITLEEYAAEQEGIA